MKKHGLSHGLAVLGCTISSALLVDIVRKHVPLVSDFVTRVSVALRDSFEIQYAPDHISIVLYASILAVLWGVAFAWMHSD